MSPVMILMAAGDTQITIAGNLVDDPELRFTPAGQPVAKFRVASTPRYLDKTTNEWKDGDSLFLTCNVWRQAAENAAETLTPRDARHRLRPAAAAVV
jgi:single-strand DNA-binding protein